MLLQASFSTINCKFCFFNKLALINFISGKELGETKLSFSIGETSSADIDLQVFPPLRVFPRNTTLLLGSTLQFSSTGGPQPDCHIEYSALVKSIAGSFLITLFSIIFTNLLLL